MLKILEPFFMLALLIALGGHLYASKLLDLEFCRRLSRLVVRVTFPAMLFVSMYAIDLPTLRQGWIFTAVGLGTSILLAFTAHYSGVLYGLKGMAFGTYQILCTNGNNIFLPVPIIAALFGSEYVVYAVLFELGAGLFYWSYGVSHFGSGRRLSFKRLLNPNTLALLAGFALGLMGIVIPGPILGALQIIGNMTVGSAMLIIGALVMSLWKKRLKPRREVWGVVLHRLLGSPLVGVIVLSIVPLPAELGRILLLLMSMPPLVTTALVAASFNADEELAAMGVVVPTLLSFMVLPIALSLF
ncbi:MAG TPA: hypothetical protein DDW87_13745 [Firmicutes bacterium]|nr:hypothetical protein [Bacillota bacterium]